MPHPEVQKLAALDNATLCEAMWRSHGLNVEEGPGCVACVGPAPRFYPNLVTIDPEASADDQVSWIIDRSAPGGFVVKDSFQALPLASHGFEPLFQATWIDRPEDSAPPTTLLNWRSVADDTALRAWETAWSDGAGHPPLFLASFLRDPRVILLDGIDDRGAIVAGCVLTKGPRVTGLSNVLGSWPEVVGAALRAAAGQHLVGYERGDDLLAATKAGFRRLGELTVWKRQLRTERGRFTA